MWIMRYFYQFLYDTHPLAIRTLVCCRVNRKITETVNNNISNDTHDKKLCSFIKKQVP